MISSSVERKCTYVRVRTQLAISCTGQANDKMVKRCVAAGCSNTNADGVSLYKFPKDEALRSQWIKQVQRFRAEWTATSYSVLCSQHFNDDCFEPDSKIAATFGMQKAKRLKSGAVPTIFDRPSSSEEVRRKRVAEPTSLVSGTKKRRSAYEKRENYRIVEELLATAPSQASQTSESDACASGVSVMEQENVIQSGLESVSICSGQTKRHARVQARPQTKSKGTQVNFRPSVKEAGIQCDLPIRMVSSTPLREECIASESDFSDIEGHNTSKVSSQYVPSTSQSSQSESESDAVYATPPPEKQTTYIVFESALLLLFSACIYCGKVTTKVKKFVNGSFLRVTQWCNRCKRKRVWESQPFIGDVPAGNLLTSAAILYAGALPAKALRVFSTLNCATISYSTFFRHQSTYLIPAVNRVYQCHQRALLNSLKDIGGLVVAGDGRADSPGHSAKYGTYSVIELTINKVVDFQLVQSNEVGGSYYMEKEGLERVIAFLKENGLSINVIVTDRHRQIDKWIRETYTDMEHYYDAWHVAKGVRKKIEALAKQKDCNIVGEWQKSILNHLYWCVASSPNGDSELVQAKWLSLENHIHNVHRGHSKKFPKCTHPRLQASERNKKWLKRHTKASEKLCSILTNATLLKSITRLSPSYQTSSLESFHSVIIHYAPKSCAFSYQGMKCRLQLATLHFNENSSREQAVTREGKQSYEIVYPKYKKGGYVVRKVTVDPTYKYIRELLTETVNQHPPQDHTSSDPVQKSTPKPLCSGFERPSKEAAIKTYKSRFSLN